MTIETIVAEQFIATKLRGDPTLVAALANGTAGIWTDVLPPDAGYPAVQVLHYTGSDLIHMGNVHIWADLVYIVRGVVTGRSFLPLKTIAKRIDAVLSVTSGSTADGEVLGCHRENPFRMVEDDGERSFRYLGGFYRLFVKDT